MKISPSYIQLLLHFTVQTHDAKSAKKAIIGPILGRDHGDSANRNGQIQDHTRDNQLNVIQTRDLIQ